MNQLVTRPCFRAVTTTAVLIVSLTADAGANPVSLGAPGIFKAVTFAVAALAIGLEVALVGYLACWIYDIKDRRGFMIRFASVNVCTYSLFVLGLHRFVKRVWITEGLIWGAESVALFLLIAAMSGKEPRMKHVLALSFFGNLLSFAVGWMG